MPLSAQRGLATGAALAPIGDTVITVGIKPTDNVEL